MPSRRLGTKTGLNTSASLTLAGCAVTVDALNTQCEIARKVKEYEAEYVMALKGNQGALCEYVAWLFATEVTRLDNVFETHECKRGREEYRRCAVLAELDYLQEHQWPGLESIAKVVSEHTIKGETTCEARYYLCSFRSKPLICYTRFVLTGKLKISCIEP